MGESIAVAGTVSEWHPTSSTYGWWAVLGGILGGLAALVYLAAASGGRYPDAVSINIVLGLALILVVATVHEGIHGIAVLAFGGRPQFGILRQGRVVWGFYATALGSRFSRSQYLTIALAPLVVLAPIGLLLCLSPVGWALWFPFGVHLGGCIGDLTIVRHVISSPSGTLFEDLRDGFRRLA